MLGRSGKLTNREERGILRVAGAICRRALLASLFGPNFQTGGSGSMAHRRKGSRNWARGVLATFWILLAGVSGLYLFSAFTDPTLGGQLAKFAPASSGETTAAVGS